MKKRILVTGGAGFIGSHLCKRLLEEENEVLCLDNYFTGKKTNVLPLLKNPYFELVRHDIMNPYYAEVDEIYNLACPASIQGLLPCPCKYGSLRNNKHAHPHPQNPGFLPEG